MKQLLLCRHAKSSWKNRSLADRDRPLNKRGKKNAPMMGRRLITRMMLPERIFCSPAKRAKKTAVLLCHGMKQPTDIIINKDDIYDTNVRGLLRIIRSIDDRYQRIMLVGHNFELTDLVNFLLQIDLYNVPTCGIVACRCETNNWKKIGRSHAELLFFDYPKKPGCGR